ncbi:MAG: glycosyltransferase family 4 protein [Cyclobacteriaceae bacterium]|nr:glycosyltransferase family 4 protein [Cyclobacteriaceae bacterium]MCB0505672.1 glycosyltransferase family 4 protein [Cyclobacteriaceae bacterium]MCB9236642.1 glycosyltransferase family 4 protein [Flammeovirgaceae bacterium]
MKVYYYFRCQRPGNYSIENVFDPIVEALADKLDTSVFYASKPFDWYSIFRVMRKQADIHHITGAENYLALGLPSKKTILTVHDIGHLTNTLTGFKRKLYKSMFWNIPPIKKIHITTISEYTKQQILSNFSIKPEKITVIPNPVSRAFQKSYRPFDKDIPVILQIGGGRNKNIESLIAAIKGIKCKLLLVRKPEQALRNLLLGSNIVHEFRYGLTIKEVVQAYRDCDMVFFASTYEGFGLPIIEAQATGRPVITGNVASMPEVLIEPGSAVMVSPLSVEEIRAAILRICADTEFREGLINKGYINVKYFSVDIIAQRYFNLYNQMNGN